MSLSTQKLVQSYLDRHEIGKLFEDMMAKLIMEMPNEPIMYLMKLLQKTCQRRSGGNTYPSAILYKPGMSLTGSSIPLKYSKDPQIVLPGSKSSMLPWLEESTEKEAVIAENNVKSQVYEKPWLPGSKLSKGLPKHENKDAGKTEPLSWNTKSPANALDDLLDEKIIESEAKKGLEGISRSQLTQKENQRSNKGKDRGSSYDLPSDDKENNVLQRTVIYSNSISNINKKESYDDELKVDSHPSSDKKKICSPKTYSKFKRKISKKKSPETKQKLQALLSIGDGKCTRVDDDIGDSDYEGEHAFEDASELQTEGARSISSVGVKRAHRMPANDAKISVCSRCAQAIDCNLKHSSGNTFSDNENFESVSQLDQEKTYKLDWPAVTNSEVQDGNLTNSCNMDVLQNKIGDEDKSDFFEKNNPVRNKAKRFAGDFISGSESEVVEDDINILLPKSKAWQQQIADIGSDADTDSKELKKGSAWKQKVAQSEIVSDI